jgi:hypothetical protein
MPPQTTKIVHTTAALTDADAMEATPDEAAEAQSDR